MKRFQAEYSYYIQEGDVINLEAEDRDDLEKKVIEYAQESAPPGIIKDIKLEVYREIK